MKLTKQFLRQLVKEELEAAQIQEVEIVADPQQQAFLDFAKEQNLSKADLVVIQGQIAMLMGDPTTPEN